MWTHLSFVLVLFSLFLLGTARAEPVRRRASPCVRPRALLHAALRRAHLDNQKLRSLRKRLRWSSLLPRLSARLGGLEGSGLNIELTPGRDGLDARRSRALTWELRLVWDLGRLAYDQRELALEREERHRAQARQRLVAAVSALLAARQRARRAKQDDLVALLAAQIDVLAGSNLGAHKGSCPSILRATRKLGGSGGSKNAAPDERRRPPPIPTLRRGAAERDRDRR